jgi:hypothetical protein
MAISPEKLLENKDSILDDMEKQIDAILEQKTISVNGFISISISLGFRADLSDELFQRYYDAGWKRIECTSEQRHGTYIKFYN